ncbi:MAG: prepilin-type N-terminal cleavage/methylation domain-containing protein [Myxococcales bacterium]|nr:MAG: prepilin-type N-terminal cleavage/methylation domain-containing protein [Myxococcales bacterium]
MQLTSFKRSRGYERRRARGFNLIEIVVAIAIIAMLSAAVTVGVVKVKKGQDIELTRTNAQSLRSAVKVWWALGNKDCPTVPQLIAEGALDKSRSTKADAWDQPWVIKCEGDDATVISRGPDKSAETEDDIVVPNG